MYATARFLEKTGYDVPAFDVDPNIAEPDESISQNTLSFYSKELDLIVEVPPKTPTDFASIPWYLLWLIKVNGRHRLAAALHDWLYQNLGFISDGIRLTKAQCDMVMREAMEVLNTSQPTLNLIHSGLKVGGFTGWFKSKRKNKKKAKYFLKFGAEKYKEKHGKPSRAVLYLAAKRL